MRINRSRVASYERCRQRAIEAFVEVRGADAVAGRAAEITALPSKEWNGATVFEVECEGPFGRGPHRQFVPEYVLWSLINVRHLICPYHR